jgi:sialate O-acetylesterase
MKIKICIIFLFISISCLLNGQIKVASVFGDNMVLQRNSEIKLWGKTTPNEKLSITVGWDKSKITTLSNEKGDWFVKVKTAGAGGPYALSISNKSQKVAFNNILLGEVWLCSGQSNMEMTMTNINDSPVNGTLTFASFPIKYSVVEKYNPTYINV